MHAVHLAYVLKHSLSAQDFTHNHAVQING